MHRSAVSGQILYWSAADGSPTRYEVNISGNAGSFGSLAYTCVSADEYYFEAALGSYAHVRACNNTGCSAYASRGPTHYYSHCQ